MTRKFKRRHADGVTTHTGTIPWGAAELDVRLVVDGDESIVEYKDGKHWRAAKHAITSCTKAAISREGSDAEATTDEGKKP